MENDSLAQAPTWVGFAFHVFDKVWYVLGGLIPGFLAGWLAMNKPKFMQKKAEPAEAEAK